MWISLMRNLANNGNQPRNPHFHSEIHRLHVRRSLLDQPWMTKLQHLQTIQTCHCQRMSKTYENRSIQRWALPSKPDHWNPEKKYMQIWKKTFNSNMWISLMRNLANNGNQPRNPHFHSEIHHLHVRRSLLDQPWMTKLQHLQTIQTCHCHRMPGKYGKVTSWHAAAFSDSAEPIPHTRPWRPRHQSGWLPTRCSWRTRLSSAPRPRPGNRDRSRLASSSRALPFKSWSLKSGEHMTFNSDMWISLIQT